MGGTSSTPEETVEKHGDEEPLGTHKNDSTSTPEEVGSIVDNMFAEGASESISQEAREQLASRQVTDESASSTSLEQTEKQMAAQDAAVSPTPMTKASSGVQLVSLGSSFGPKMSFQSMGYNSEPLPFDTISTRIDGLLHYLRSDFNGFFSFVSKETVPESTAVMYRDYFHSFWYEDPSDPGVHADYKDRIARLLNIGKQKSTVLFVRVIVSKAELSKTLELQSELMARFGEHVCLLLIIDFQVRVSGFGTVQDNSNLLVYFADGEAHKSSTSQKAPYEVPIKAAMDWLQCAPVDAMVFPDIDHVIKFSDETEFGIYGLGGLFAFEDDPGAQPSLDANEPDYKEFAASALALAKAAEAAMASQATEKPVYTGQSRNPTESDLLERMGLNSANGNVDDGIALISLGCYCGTKLTFQKMGRGAATLPFDWMRTSHESIVRFLKNDFEGFFDFNTKMPVPGVNGMIMYRSSQHSFWHDDPSHWDTREKYGRRITRFNQMGQNGQTLLFVRSIGTTDELLHAEELLGLLQEKFGEVCLLLIISFQVSNNGAFFLESNDSILVYLMSSESFHGPQAAAPFIEPVQVGIDWVKGEAIEANCVDCMDTLLELVDATHWGFVGLGNLDAFEDPALLPRAKDPNSKADDNITQVVDRMAT